MRCVVLLALALCACFIPTERGLSIRRSRLWVAPGSPTVFSWVSTIEHRKTEVLNTGSTGSLVETEKSDTPVRTTVFAVDPVTRRETRLGQLDDDGGVPIYYDAAREIVWVRGKHRELTGIARSGQPVGGAQHQRQLEVEALSAPFVLAEGTDNVALYDLRRDEPVPLPPEVARAEIVASGDLVRFTMLTEVNQSVRVHQIAIDWSSGHPQRLADLDWATAPLAPGLGTRVAFAMMRDGRYAEVIRDAAGTRLVVHDITTDAAAIQIPLPAYESPARPVATLAAMAGDALVFGEREQDSNDDKRCWRGAAIRVDQRLVVPLGNDICVFNQVDAGQQRALVLMDAGTAVVGADARIVRINGLVIKAFIEGIATGETTRIVAHEDGALEQLDVATGERRPLARGPRSDQLLAVDGGTARYARGSDKLVTLALRGSSSPIVLDLGEPTLSRDDRMPRDRTELWLGASGGGATRRNPAWGIFAEVAHWVSPHWTWVVRGSGRFEDTNDKKHYADLGGSFGYAWHRLPRLASLSLEADVGANVAMTSVEKMGTEATFAPSAELHVGWQGKMFGLDVAAVVPSLIDPGRGMVFMVNAKIGFTENLR